jgi:hypothetical protein
MLTTDMNYKLHITDRDRLLAAGLMAFIQMLLLAAPISDYKYDFESPVAFLIVGIFATGALVFSISPLLHGSKIQKCLGVLFVLPSLIFLITVVHFWVSHRAGK